jgi:hypothetical protein
MTGVTFIKIPPGVFISENFIAFLPFHEKPTGKGLGEYLLATKSV